MTRKNRLSLILIALALPLVIQAAGKQSTYEEYIKKYSHIAKQQQKKYGIPASITLAQGLLESAAAQSWLAQQSNNHFGIKCGNDWTGETILHDDEQKHECFRKYKKPEDSFEDHSLFLKRPRYQKLFELAQDDYKAWAHGLKQCGYATDPNYANKLIKLIEDYELYKFDKKDWSESDTKEKKQEEQQQLEDDEIKVDNSAKSKSKKNSNLKSIDLYHEHKLYKHNGRKYIVANSGETFAGLAYEYNITEKALRRYNDATDGRELREGDKVYLFQKRSRAAANEAFYRVKRGDTAWSIAQDKGIKLSTIYKLNGIPKGLEVTINQELKLR